MENDQLQEKVERENGPSLWERFGRYLAGREGKRIDRSLREIGFFRTYNQMDDASLPALVSRMYDQNNSGSLTELYIAPAVLFGESDAMFGATDAKYVVYMRSKLERELQFERGRRI